MLGLILGTLCLVALIATVRRRRFGYFAYAYPGWRGWYGPPPFFGFHRHHHVFDDGPHRYGTRRGRHGFTRALFERLETTPGQEKVIAQALSTVVEQLQGAHDELNSARKDLAAALGGDTIDGPALDRAVAQHKQLVDRFGHELTQALISVHEVLDGEQRKELAELIAHGPLRGLRGFGRF